MNFKLNKKVILSVFVMSMLILASFYFGLIISKFNKVVVSDDISAVEKTEITEFDEPFVPIGNEEKPEYYSYSVFEEKFYGPFDKENIKDGDYYMKVSYMENNPTPNTFLVVNFFDKDKKLIEPPANDYGYNNLYLINRKLYRFTGDKIFYIKPEQNFDFIELSNEEYEKLKIKRILTKDITDGESVDISGYKYYYFADICDDIDVPMSVIRTYAYIYPVPNNSSAEYQFDYSSAKTKTFTIISKN